MQIVAWVQSAAEGPGDQASAGTYTSPFSAVLDSQKFLEFLMAEEERRRPQPTQPAEGVDHVTPCPLICQLAGRSLWIAA